MTPEEQEEYIQHKTQIINEYEKKQEQFKKEQEKLINEMKIEQEKLRKLSNIAQNKNISQLQKSAQTTAQNVSQNQLASQNIQKDKKYLTLQGFNRNNKYGQTILGQIDASESQYLSQNDQSLSPKNQNKSSKLENTSAQENKIINSNHNVDCKPSSKYYGGQIQDQDGNVLSNSAQVFENSDQYIYKPISQVRSLSPEKDNLLKQNNSQNQNVKQKTNTSFQQSKYSLFNQNNSSFQQESTSENQLRIQESDLQQNLQQLANKIIQPKNESHEQQQQKVSQTQQQQQVSQKQQDMQNQQQQLQQQQQQKQPPQQQKIDNQLFDNAEQNNKFDIVKKQDFSDSKNQNQPQNSNQQNILPQQLYQEFKQEKEISQTQINKYQLEFSKREQNQLQNASQNSPVIDPISVSLSKNLKTSERKEQYYGADIIIDHPQSEKNLNAIYEDTKENISTIQNNSGSYFQSSLQQSSSLRVQGNQQIVQQQNNSKLSQFGNLQKNLVPQHSTQQQMSLSNELPHQPIQQQINSVNQPITQVNQQSISDNQQLIQANDLPNKINLPETKNTQPIALQNKQDNQMNFPKNQTNQPNNQNQSISQPSQQVNQNSQNNTTTQNSQSKSVQGNSSQNGNPQNQNIINNKQGLKVDSLNTSHSQTHQNQQQPSQQTNQQQLVKNPQQQENNLTKMKEQLSLKQENDLFKNETQNTQQTVTQQLIPQEQNNDFTVQNKYDANKEIFNSLLLLRSLDQPEQSHLKMKVYTLQNANQIQFQWDFISILANSSPIAPNIFHGNSKDKDQDTAGTVQRKSTFISYNYNTSKLQKEFFKDIHILYLMNKEFRQNRVNTPLPILLNLPVCFEISKNQLEIVLETSRFVSMTEIIRKRKESSGQTYTENELAFIFHSILKSLEVFEKKGLLHGYLVTDNLIYCFESQCYKLLNFSQCQTFSIVDQQKNNNKQYQVQYKSPYLSSHNQQIMGDTNKVTKPPFFAERYALGVSFFCIQQLIEPNEANYNIINRAIKFQLQNFDESLASTQLIQYLLGRGQYNNDINNNSPEFWNTAYKILDRIQHEQPNEDDQSNQQKEQKLESTLNLLAEQSYTTFQFSKSLEYYLELLQIQKQNYGNEDEKILPTLNKIWKIYYSQNDVQNSYTYCSKYTTLARENYKKQKKQFEIGQNKIKSLEMIQSNENLQNMEYPSSLNKLQRNLITDFNLSGQLKWQINKQKEAIEDYEMALSLQIEIYGENEYNVIKNLNNIGVYYSNIQNRNKAIQIISQAVQKMEQQNITDNLYTSALYNLGNLLSENDQPKEALQYLTKSYEIKKKTQGNSQEIGKIAHLIGTLHFQLKSYQLSLNFLEEAVQITSKFLESDDAEIIKYKRNLIVSLVKNNQNKQANDQIEQIIQILSNSTLKTFADSPGQVFYEIGGFFEKILKYDYALICYDKSATYWQQMEISVTNPSLSACLKRINSLKTKLNQPILQKDSNNKQSTNIQQEQNNSQQQNNQQKQSEDQKQKLPEQNNQQQGDIQQKQKNLSLMDNESKQNIQQLQNNQQQSQNQQQQNNQQQTTNKSQQVNDQKQINQSSNSNQIPQPSEQSMNNTQQKSQTVDKQQNINQQQIGSQQQQINLQPSTNQQNQNTNQQLNPKQIVSNQNSNLEPKQNVQNLTNVQTNKNISQQKTNSNKQSIDQTNQQQTNQSQNKQEDNKNVDSKAKQEVKQQQQLNIINQQSQFPSQTVITENFSQTINKQVIQNQAPINQLYGQFKQNTDQYLENKNNSLTKDNSQPEQKQIQQNIYQQLGQSQNKSNIQQKQSQPKQDQIQQSSQQQPLNQNNQQQVSVNKVIPTSNIPSQNQSQNTSTNGVIQANSNHSQSQQQNNQQTSINGVIPAPNIPSQNQSLGNQMPKLEHLTQIPTDKQN